jgi:succinyl-CoA synthetase beta subunit
MKIHEYQGKGNLAHFWHPVAAWHSSFTVQEAVEAAQKLGGPVCGCEGYKFSMQVGRGRAVASSCCAATTRQSTGWRDPGRTADRTGRTLPDKVRRLLIEEGGHRKEYVSAVTDRALQRSGVHCLQRRGGMDIEEVARSAENIHQVHQS